MTWKREIIEGVLVLTFAIGIWWWLDKEIQKDKVSFKKPCPIVCGYWSKDGVLELVKEE